MVMIRHIQPQDIFSVIKIAYETLPERYKPSIFNTFYETFPQGFLIAQKHQKIIGFLIGIKINDITAKILMLAVNNEFRRQKIGSELIKNFIKEMILNNIKIINLEVRINNKTAIEFYKKHGFKIEDKIIGFYQNKKDAYTMKLNLNPY